MDPVGAPESSIRSIRDRRCGDCWVHGTTCTKVYKIFWCRRCAPAKCLSHGLSFSLFFSGDRILGTVGCRSAIWSPTYFSFPGARDRTLSFLYCSSDYLSRAIYWQCNVQGKPSPSRCSRHVADRTSLRTFSLSFFPVSWYNYGNRRGATFEKRRETPRRPGTQRRRWLCTTRRARSLKSSRYIATRRVPQ